MLSESFLVDVTVIITTYNRAAGLTTALAGLLAQALPAAVRFEIVVVDDGSTDETMSVLREIQARSELVRVVRVPNGGVSRAREVGVQHAAGAWIAFCDDDQIPSPEWLGALYHVAQTTGAACVGGPVSLLLPPGCTMELGARARRLLGEDDFGNAVRPYPNGACPGTGNVIIRRDVLEQVGGFDPAFAQGGEDAELFGRVRAAGLRILYAPEARMQHVIPPGRLRPDFFRWVARRIGVADARIYHKHVSLAGILRRVVLRVGALALRDGPIVMLWPRSGQRRLDAICSMQYTLAFVRGIASFVAPDVFSNERYIRGLHFSNHGGERGHEVRA